MVFRPKTHCFATFLFLATAVLAVPASVLNDRRIEAAALGSYSLRVVLADQGPVTVNALNGVVSLTGVVRDEDGKTLAEDTVDNIPGVARVENRLTVAAGPADDAAIGRAVRRRLLILAETNAETTRIAVDDGRVTLSGPTPSLRLKQLAETSAAAVANVKAVRNDLVVAGMGAAAARALTPVDDPSINVQVKYALAGRRCAADDRTRIRTRDGMVMISGFVESEAEKETITQLARDLRGVQGVVNSMRVKP